MIVKMPGISGSKPREPQMPPIVKRYSEKGETFVLTQDIKENSMGYSNETLSLYREQNISNKPSYELLETKEVNRTPKGIRSIKKKVFVKGQEYATFDSFDRGKSLFAFSPDIEVSVEKPSKGNFKITNLHLRRLSLDTSNMRPEIKRIFKLIANSFGK